jgi:3,4-dihydroxy-9,10-secoandrosta-1,3,5(10)-triene-9,17-dione 4,5-dioxygenase
VQQLVSFADPSGNRHELVWGFQSDFIRFASPAGVALRHRRRIGMGHTVLPAPEFEATARFLREVMGFGLSDIFNFKPAGDAGPTLPIHFFHCNNGRHHSLAWPASRSKAAACT